MVEQPDLHLLTHQPQIENLRTFSVWGRLMPGATGVIASAAFRPNLEELDLTQSYLEGDWTRALAIVAWPKLRSLDLGGNELTDTGVRSLLPLIPRLTDLSLCGSNITDAGALALADAIDPEKMERFSLSYNPLSPETVDALRIRFGERFHFTASTGPP
ncbi:Leucine Rich repeats (2 copies) [Gemmata sp. SH-PL17]|nr:Leucine Rich repeats (2 copies) [Gemmata sp. SH-PL17]